MSDNLSLKPDAGPTLSDTILAMDIVDTLRHDERIIETELREDDRRLLLKERLKAQYLAQGDVVSDDILDQALVQMHQSRLIHKPALVGKAALPWKLYIKRGRIALSAATLAAAVFLVGLSVDAVKQYGIRKEAELVRTLENVVATAAERRERGVEIAREFNEPESEAKLDALLASVRLSAQQKDETSAQRSLKGIESEIVRLSAKVKAEQEKAARLRAREALIAASEELSEAAVAGISDPDALHQINARVGEARQAALEGDTVAYDTARATIERLRTYILNPATIRIVNRKGVQTGFSRVHDQTGVKSWYVVVEAISPSGQPYPMDIDDRLLGTRKLTSIWALHVTPETFEAVRADKAADGVVDANVIGTKKAGRFSVDWSMPVNNGAAVHTW